MNGIDFLGKSNGVRLHNFTKRLILMKENKGFKSLLLRDSKIFLKFKSFKII